MVDANNIAALGYCFGGSVMLQMARLSQPFTGEAALKAIFFAAEILRSCRS